MLFGATQTLFARYVNPVWAGAVVIGLAVVILRFRPEGSRIPTRLKPTTALGSAGVLVAIVLLAVAPLFLGTYYLGLLTISLVYGVLAVSLDLVWGYTGIPDLGHALWFGIGALSVAMATTTARLLRDRAHDVPRARARTSPGSSSACSSPVPSPPSSGSLSFSQREADPFYIAIVTLALTVVAGTIYGQLPQYTGGDNGIFGFAYHGLTNVQWYYVSAAVARRRRGRRARPRAQRLRPGHARRSATTSVVCASSASTSS